MFPNFFARVKIQFAVNRIQKALVPAINKNVEDIKACISLDNASTMMKSYGHLMYHLQLSVPNGFIIQNRDGENSRWQCRNIKLRFRN